MRTRFPAVSRIILVCVYQTVFFCHKKTTLSFFFLGQNALLGLRVRVCNLSVRQFEILFSLARGHYLPPSKVDLYGVPCVCLSVTVMGFETGF